MLHTVLRIRIRMDQSYLGSRIQILIEDKSRIRNQRQNSGAVKAKNGAMDGRRCSQWRLGG